MEKVTMELTDKEFNAISELLAAFSVQKYKKAVGDHTITASYIEVSNDVARVLNRLDKKINS